ncbi:MAG: hypothetical protein OMM_01781 [Candidatus Magnetoglobus multicellularis str. Araruama]|uniref:Uncharacterized protein n=1 Tax=Candidatus Magnetoglobus multicellularis str. Araruama TaxID=890399 RepID=A0A1V1PBR9_9BACT|nr:MAG: hypothetical protein OMM_01781 [Candidatus Magnetoglobus multicellularis str. Araruama]
MKCIDSVTMADYILGLLSFTDNLKIRWHIFRCGHCMKNYQSARFLVNEKGDHEYPISENEALSFLNNLGSSKQTLNVRSGHWINNLGTQVPIRSRNTSSEEFDYYEIQRFFSELDTKIYFEKIDARHFYMDVKTIPKENTNDHLDFVLEKFKGTGQVQRPFKDGEAIVKKLPFGSYRMIINQNEIFKGDYYFTIDEDGFHEK